MAQVPLEKIPAFVHLSATDIAALRDLIAARHYTPRELIFVEGEPSDSLWFIQSGRVRLYRTSPNGRELTICVASAEDKFCLGTCPLFDGDTHPVNAQALDHVTLLVVNRRVIHDRAAGNSDVAHALGRMMGDRYRHFSKLVTNLGLRCVRARVADLLLEFADKRGHLSARGIELDMDLNQETVATLIGTDRAVIARMFLQFEREGAIDVHGRHVIITDRGKLVQALQAP